MSEPVVFNAERANYYRAKKRELARQAKDNIVVKEDAIFIKYYGMSAFIELFPEVKGFSINWHRAIIRELQSIERRDIGSTLAGHRMAIMSTKDKSSARSFRRLIKDVMRG